MGYFIGIDGGGTNTRCVLADDHRELARVSGGTVKTSYVGEDAAADGLRSLMQETSRQAGVTLSQISAVCLGLAGIWIPGRTEWAMGILREMVPGVCLACEDIDIALDAAFQDEAGVLVAAGTGSNVMARNTQGVLTQAGGLGPVISDEGSGVWIGRQAVAMALFAHQGGEAGSIMLENLMVHCECDSPEALASWANHVKIVEFSTLAPIVHYAATAGDTLAASILTAAGKELAQLVAVAIARLPGDTKNEVSRIAFSGSILENVIPVRDAMRDHLPFGITLMQQAVDPVAGALWRARQSTINSPSPMGRGKGEGIN